MTPRQRVQLKKTVRARRKSEAGDSSEQDRERSAAASRRAQNVTQAARRFLARTAQRKDT